MTIKQASFLKMLGLVQFCALAFVFTTTRAICLDEKATITCHRLKLQYNDSIILPDQTQYIKLADENWSQTAWATPSCIFRPENASEVQRGVRILASRQTPFAIRSGGHLPSPFGANINSGVLIDLSRLTTLKFDLAEETVTIGSGLRWGDVYDGLAQYNRTAVGGRLLDIGVGGLILGSTGALLSLSPILTDIKNLIFKQVVFHIFLTSTVLLATMW